MNSALHRLLFLLIGGLFLSCNAVEPERDSRLVISDFILENYLDDARQIYFSEVAKDTNSKAYNSITIDSSKVWEKLELFQAVYNSATPEADTVFNVIQIHAKKCFSFNSILMKVETDSTEIQKLAEFSLPTGNIELDALLTTYEIDSVQTAYGYPASNWLILYSSGTYNMLKAASDFHQISSIQTEINTCDVESNLGGNTIMHHQVTENETFLTFSLGSGDCPSGCFYHHNWEFLIDNKEAYFQRKYLVD